MALQRISLFFAEEVELGKTEDGKRIPPKEFRVFRAGWNESKKGTFLFDEEAAKDVIALWKAEGNPLMGDYNHDVFGPASLTQFDLDVRDGELWAINCQYTTRAWKALEDGELRLMSPEFLIDPETGRIRQLLAIALTNRPALLHLTPLVAATAIDAEPLARAKENAMDPKDQEIARLRAQVDALTEKANGGELVALTAAMGVNKPGEGVMVAQALVQLRADLIGETGAKSTAEALGKIKAWKQDASEVSGLRVQLSDLEQKSLSSELDAILAKANDEAKITPAGREAARAIAMVDGKVSRDGLMKLSAFVSTLTPVVTTVTAAAQGGGATHDQGHVALTAVSESQKRVNAELGINQEKFAKWEERLRAEGKWTGLLAATS